MIFWTMLEGSHKITAADESGATADVHIIIRKSDGKSEEEHLAILEEL